MTEVLNHQQIKDRITRIAWQIYEEYHQQEKVIFVGIAERGFRLASLIADELKAISPLEVALYQLSFDKDNIYQTEFRLSPSIEDLQAGNVVLIDDVLNSGSTLIHAVRYLLRNDLQNLKTVVMVDRNHKRFPVKADFKGLSLSTSTQEHVKVNLEKEPYAVTVS